MANFVVITGQHGYDHVNLDVVRHITDDGDGQITLRFDLTHRVTLNREDSRRVMNEITKTQKTVA